MLMPPSFLIEEMNKRHMSQSRLGELLNCRRPAVNGMLSGMKRLNRDKLKEIFPDLSQQIDDHRIALSCPLCGFGVVMRKKSVHCSHCHAFVCGETLSNAISKWNERHRSKPATTLSCALCGGRAIVNGHSIRCNRCGFGVCSAMGNIISKDVVLKLWNRRYRVKKHAR